MSQMLSSTQFSSFLHTFLLKRKFYIKFQSLFIAPVMFSQLLFYSCIQAAHQMLRLSQYWTIYGRAREDKWKSFQGIKKTSFQNGMLAVLSLYIMKDLTNLNGVCKIRKLLLFRTVQNIDVLHLFGIYRTISETGLRIQIGNRTGLPLYLNNLKTTLNYRFSQCCQFY